jgi:hypothetical protein
MLYWGVILRLRLRLRTIKEKSYNFFEDFLADVHGAVNAIGRFHPIHFANSDVPWLSCSAIAELDREQIAAQDYRQAMKWIAMPRRRLPRCQPLSPDQVISTTMQHLLISERFHTSRFYTDCSADRICAARFLVVQVSSFDRAVRLPVIVSL